MRYMSHEVPQAVIKSAPKLSQVIKSLRLPLLCKYPGQQHHCGILFKQYALVVGPNELDPEESEMTLRKWFGGPPPGKQTDIDNYDTE